MLLVHSFKIHLRVLIACISMEIVIRKILPHFITELCSTLIIHPLVPVIGINFLQDNYIPILLNDVVKKFSHR